MSQSPALARGAKPIRVMVVDDSAVIRGLVSSWVKSEPDLEVAASCFNGLDALRHIRASRAEVVVLDIEMPDMDGLTALPKLIQAAPGVKIVMSSTLTQKNAEISIRALSMGAADYIPKPQSTQEITASSDFRADLIEKVRTLGAASRGLHAPAPAPGRPAAPRPKTSSAAWTKSSGAVSLLRLQPRRREIIAIGSSTGGPQALSKVLGDIGKRVSVPILITQHMPKMFTAILAEHISKSAGRPCEEAKDGETISNGRIYLAPGDFHMRVVDKGGRKCLQLSQDPPINYCRPAVDPMFESVAQHYGASALGVVLTGMGNDGADGGRQISQAGGALIAQDEATSVVWGMPGATAHTGACHKVSPLGQVGADIINITQGVGG
ncbi:MAG: chemotaxis response regulator protein-glutamate methylesterase [Pseudomonadota bacterium]